MSTLREAIAKELAEHDRLMANHGGCQGRYCAITLRADSGAEYGCSCVPDKAWVSVMAKNWFIERLRAELEKGEGQ